MAKQKTIRIFSLMILAAVCCLLTAGLSEATYSSNNVPNVSVFPYINSGTTYTSSISVFNRSAYQIDVTYEFRKFGFIGRTTHRTVTLEPHSVDRYTPSNFTGSVNISALGEADALFCMLETRANNGKGVALTEPAGNNYVWFYHLAVKDQGPNKEHTTLTTYNFSDTLPIYVTYIWSKNNSCYGYCFEKLVSPQSAYSFCPYDFSNEAYDGEIYVEANTGPKRTGTQVNCFSGALFYESSDTIALYNYKPPHFPYASAPNYPTGYENWYKMYFTDVQDDGVNRTDRIHLKLNTATSSSSSGTSVTIPFTFYDQDGKELTYATLNPVKLADMFDLKESYQVVSPMQLLGSKFSGSILIDNPNWQDGKLEALIVRKAPNQWRDITDYSPPGGKLQGYNCLPYVSNKTPNWIYQIVLFYPKATANNTTSPPTDPKDLPPTFTGPTKNAPTPVYAGYAYLKFYDLNGNYKGTFAFKMNANQTLYKPLNDAAVTAYIKDFEGAVVIEPRDVVVQLQLFDKNKTCHASSGNWYTMNGY